MRENRSSGSVEGVMGNHDSYSDSIQDPIPAGDVRDHPVEQALQAAGKTLHAASDFGRNEEAAVRHFEALAARASGYSNHFHHRPRGGEDGSRRAQGGLTRET